MYNHPTYNLKLFFLFVALFMQQCSPPNEDFAHFNGERAFKDIEYQVLLGPRIPNSEAHEKEIKWIAGELQESGWKVEIQESVQMGHPVKNVIGKWGEGDPWIVLGTHYDSRMVSDHDPNIFNQSTPVPGANDGASGVALLLELARNLPHQLKANQADDQTGVKQIWLVFFDAEDNGNIPGWDWILGSRAFVQNLEDKPTAAIIVDMIGDANLNIYQEKNSDPAHTKEIWDQAQTLGYTDEFIPFPKYGIIDDHIPFLEAGIPAVDVIDIEYAYYHTTEDKPDKTSTDSLKAVGDTILTWLVNKRFER
jgi:Zn-dependent M28 family amino/carboxypeptidase